MHSRDDWGRLLALARRLTTEQAALVFIGGVAVATHASVLAPEMNEASHDIDVYVSLVGKSEMRDYYEFTHNPRLEKDVALIDGEELDVYTEHQHALSVPYDECAALAIEIDGIRIAALEHLLPLKLDAARSRAASSKGLKDARDLVRLLLLLEHPRRAILDPYLSTDRVNTLRGLLERGDVLRSLTANVHQQRKIREKITRRVVSLTKRAPNGL